MAYLFEELGDERFQQLCQAILVTSIPNLQCLPVGQPDGGRDALLRQPIGASPGGFVVYQVKFVRDPNSKDARDFIKDFIKSEKDKIEKLVSKGAQAYYLLTNVRGTSHLDVGSIDQLGNELSAITSIDTHCWWRDDLERRIDAYPRLRWSYPELISFKDLLPVLMNGANDAVDQRTIETLRAYMAHQYRYDDQLKFKQIDLQKTITDLFVDVPVRIVMSRGREGEIQDRLSRIDRSIREPLLRDAQSLDSSQISESALSRAPGVLQVLIREDFAREFPRVVVEGAPGQGKSTVTQLLCQVHRMSLLGKETILKRVLDIHRPREARIPFRIDLRDYASWITGRDPSSEDLDARLPPDSSPLLESFIAGQVTRHTAHKFSVDDLKRVAAASQILIVLDGFDEVADISTRNRLVNEISDAAVRLEANALSVQIIVTSRPAAFANSPGFPRDDWQHAQILSLSAAGIQNYTKKWLDGRGSDARERRDVLRVLKDKLDQPHVRDLARNPMQLAILLALISVQGASLPDKRTALYDKYIDIFFNRESEKSTTVRDYREHLIHIHRYLAWTLQTESEDQGAGHITESRLRELLRKYLSQNGHPTDAVDILFPGMLERVVVLVSRIQGTFEFEVQPLREYFAARYLYDTAPYSPAGTDISGTLPDRFEALAKNFYWLNVTRFYAGCYSTGELASLLQGLEELERHPDYVYLGHSRHLTAVLLGDYVFSQQPKLMDRLAERIVDGLGFRVVLAGLFNGRAHEMLMLPSESGRDIVRTACISLMDKRYRSDVQFSAATLIARNTDPKALVPLWYSLRKSIDDDINWANIGSFFNVYESLDIEDLRKLINDIGFVVINEAIVSERFDVFSLSPSLWQDIIMAALDGTSIYSAIYSDHLEVSPVTRYIGYFCGVLSPYSFHRTPAHLDQRSLRDIFRSGATPPTPRFEITEDSPLNDVSSVFPEHFIAILDSILDQKVGDWKSSVALWSQLIEAVEKQWGERWGLFKIAVTALECSTITNTIGSVGVDVHPICARAMDYKSSSSDRAFWIDKLNHVDGETKNHIRFTLLAMHLWCPLEIVLTLSEIVSTRLDDLSNTHWERLYFDISEQNSNFGSKNDKPLSVKNHQLPNSMSPRLACLIISRADQKTRANLYKRYLTDYTGSDKRVLSVCVDAVFGMAAVDEKHWSQALVVTAHAYKEGQTSGNVFHRYSDTKIPMDVAKSIFDHSDRYPLWLIAAAETNLRNRAGEQALPVGQVSAENGWFPEDG